MHTALPATQNGRAVNSYDHIGLVRIPTLTSTNLDVLPHPHSQSTVIYLLSGNVTHRDSFEVEQVIKSGKINWMTAEKDIAHSKRFEDPAVLAC